MATERLGYRHHCANKATDEEWVRSFHIDRDGKPRSKRCTYCNGPLVLEYGVWGTFGGYLRQHPESEAVGTYTSRVAAERAAKKHAETHGYHNALVVRWCLRGEQPDHRSSES